MAPFRPDILEKRKLASELTHAELVPNVFLTLERVKAGHKQDDVVRLAGLSNQERMSRFERGEVQPTLPEARRITKVLGRDEAEWPILFPLHPLLAVESKQTRLWWEKARKLSRKQLRKPAEATSTLDTMVEREKIERVKQLLGGLKPKERQVVELRLRGMTFRQIASAMNIATGGPIQHYYDAVFKLKRALAKSEE